MVFLALRLGQTIRGHEEVAEWAQKTRQRFNFAKPEDNDDSDTSGVLVAHGADGGAKVEDESPSGS